MPRSPRDPNVVQVITANLLREGNVVWLAEDEGWSRELSRARVFTDPAEAEATLSRAAARTGEVVGAYLAPMRPTDQGPVPVHFREDFRRTGPSRRARGLQTA
jgi:hypothetical protein